MPRATRRSPLRRLRVRTHFSYRRSTSLFEVRAFRSLTSPRTSTKDVNFSESSSNTAPKVASPVRASDPYAYSPSVDVDEAAIQPVRKETRDEERQISDAAETVTLAHPVRLESLGEANSQRLFNVCAVGAHESREQVDQIEGGQLSSRKLLVLHGQLDELTEVLRGRFVAESGLGYNPSMPLTASEFMLATDRRAKAVPENFYQRLVNYTPEYPTARYSRLCVLD